MEAPDTNRPQERERYQLPAGPGRDPIYDEPMSSYQVVLTEEWREFVAYVGDGNMSDGVRTLIEQYIAMDPKPPLNRSLPRKQRAIRTNLRLPERLVEVARKAGGGYYRPGVRGIIRAAMNGYLKPSENGED